MITDPPQSADVVVVGAGTAGAIVAEVLSREPDRSVVLVEAGSPQPDARVLAMNHLPIEHGSDRVVRYVESTGLTLVRGRGVGGCAAVNGGYFLRAHRSDFDTWPGRESLFNESAIEAAYTELDGGRSGGGRMRVGAIPDSELSSVARRFENICEETGLAPTVQPWPDVGTVRVRANRLDGRRVTTWEGFGLGAAVIERPNLSLLTSTPVEGLVVHRTRVIGVRCATGDIMASEVILCGGTIGTATILGRSAHHNPDVFGGLTAFRVSEHRERVVRYTPVIDDGGPPLLATVAHTVSGLEIRCYNGDFGRWITDHPHGQAMIGVALMHPRTAGDIRVSPEGLVDIAFAEPDRQELAEIDESCAQIVEKLSAHSDLVQPGSIKIEPVLGTSQHLWGSLALGEMVDLTGRLEGIRGLRIIDGSILPTALRSGPHATIAMVALRISQTIAA